MKNLTIKMKVFSILVIIVVAFISFLFIVENNINHSLKKAKSVHSTEISFIKAGYHLKHNISLMHNSFEELINIKDKNKKDTINELAKYHKLIQNDLNKLYKYSHNKYSDQIINKIKELEHLISVFYKNGKKIADIKENITLKDKLSNLNNSYESIIKNIKIIDNFSAAYFDRKHQEFENLIDDSVWRLMVLGICIILIIILLGSLLATTILSSLDKFKKGLDQFFDYLNRKTQNASMIDIDTKEEFGQMARSINENIKLIELGLEQDKKFIKDVSNIVDKMNNGNLKNEVTFSSSNESLELLKPLINKLLKQVYEVINDIGSILNAIAEGDYKKKVENSYKGDFDQLKSSTNILGEKLLEREQQNKMQIWLKDGLKGLNEILVEALDLQDVTKRSIDYICQYLNAGIGALYVYDEENKKLDQYACYAFVHREEFSNHFKLGEGTVGQVAMQKTPIHLRNIKREHMVIETGTISEPPLNTYTLPLLYQDNIFGVIELGSFEIFDNDTEYFLNEANKIIATAISSAKQKEIVANLLKETETTNKELEQVNTDMEEQQQQLEEVNAHMEEQHQHLVISEQELKMKNESLEISKLEIEQVSKYKSEFLANMSHELRTPLNSIILLSDLLNKNRKQNLTKQDIEKAEIINRSGNELLRLINDILDLSKVEAGRMELVIDRFKSIDLLTEMKDMFGVVANDKGLSFDIEDSYNDYIINDKVRISQIIRNLVSNAFKFTKDGTVTVKFEYSGDIDKPVKLIVSDTGIGIPTQKQKLIFEAFKQADGSTSREYGGTGLGLSISKELAKMMGGEISLSSIEGAGSSFIVILPNLYKDDEKSPVVSKEIKNELKIDIPQHKNIVQKSRKVKDDTDIISEEDEVFLVIDDDYDFANTLYEGIKEKGHKCLVSLTGSDGFDNLKKYNINGIILDLGLPDIDGVDILKKIKSNPKYQNIPVHIISSRDKDEVLFKIGAIGYTQKPVFNQDMEEAIDNLTCYSDKKCDAIKNESEFESDIDLGGLTVLAVDDDIKNIFVLDTALSEYGATIIRAKNGQESIDKIKENKDIDIVIMDIMMPVMDGYEAIAKIREDDQIKNIPIIAVTAKAMKEDRDKCIKAGADDYLAKPIDISALLQLIKLWSQKKHR
ncbi:MAG: response regulator [Campylobacterota bacterium]|nr:response regulator [Campylobacterota bacterium]